MSACHIRTHSLPKVMCFFSSFSSSMFHNAQVTIIHDNVLHVDIKEATAIFVYLVPEGMVAMRPALIEALNRGVRIVTYGKYAFTS